LAAGLVDEDLGDVPGHETQQNEDEDGVREQRRREQQEPPGDVATGHRGLRPGIFKARYLPLPGRIPSIRPAPPWDGPRVALFQSRGRTVTSPAGIRPDDGAPDDWTLLTDVEPDAEPE